MAIEDVNVRLLLGFGGVAFFGWTFEHFEMTAGVPLVFG
jgi:hypothetical protein